MCAYACVPVLIFCLPFFLECGSQFVHALCIFHLFPYHRLGLQILLISHNVRCGLIWLQRARKVEQMWLKLMYFGMDMSQLKDRCNKFFPQLVYDNSFVVFSKAINNKWYKFLPWNINIFPDFLVQYNFEGRYDLVKFVKLVGGNGLYLLLRLGPYVCAEWNFGSRLLFPF